MEALRSLQLPRLNRINCLIFCRPRASCHVSMSTLRPIIAPQWRASSDSDPVGPIDDDGTVIDPAYKSHIRPSRGTSAIIIAVTTCNKSSRRSFRDKTRALHQTECLRPLRPLHRRLHRVAHRLRPSVLAPRVVRARLAHPSHPREHAVESSRAREHARVVRGRDHEHELQLSRPSRQRGTGR